MESILAFLALAVVLSVTPGPDDVLVLRSSLRGGPRLGMTTAAGALTGTLVWGILAAFGLVVLTSQSTAAYDALRTAGGGYLILLGAAPLAASLARRRPGRHAAPTEPEAPGRSRRAFAVGLASDVLNPKIGLFYLVVVPQFIPSGGPVLAYSLMLLGIDVAVALAWFLCLAWLAHVVVGWIHRPGFAVWSQRTFCASLIGIGVGTTVGL